MIQCARVRPPRFPRKACGLLWLVALVLGHPAGAADLDVFPLHSQASVALLHGRHVYVEIYAGRLDPYLEPGAPAPAAAGAYPVRLEWERLSTAVRAMALRRLFPADAVEPGAWVHRVAYAEDHRDGERLSELAWWFTADRRHADELARHNRLADGALRNGQTLRIPRALLIPELRELVPEATASAQLLRVPSVEAQRPPVQLAAAEPHRRGRGEPAAVAPRVPQGPLSFASDEQGTYALYRLQPGEVLYSDVVVRFTGRVDVYDVGEAARLIQRRSGIRDSRELPPGTLVKIPLELLEPEFLPPSDPRHRQYVAERSEADRYRARTTAESLEGVVLVLDSGHGGADPGTLGVCGIAEDEYVHDVVLRVARLVQAETRGRVLFTVRDRVQGSAPRDARKLPLDKTEQVLTTPAYPATDTTVSAHLRWYLANSYLRRLVREGTDPGKVVFTSFHADSRHPSAPGLMVYVADAGYSKGTITKTGKAYTRHAEVREQPRYASTKEQRTRSEALSRDLADLVVQSMARAGVGVHSNVPIRGSVIRRKRRYVPAVLRYNAIPTKLLVEIANLSNRRACEAVRDPAHREKVARAYVEALGDYFGARESAELAARR